MISVGPFEPGSGVYDHMDKRGWFVDKIQIAKPPYHTVAMAVYDATNPKLANITGIDGQGPGLTLGSTPGGWIRPSPKPKPGRQHSTAA